MNILCRRRAAEGLQVQLPHARLPASVVQATPLCNPDAKPGAKPAQTRGHIQASPPQQRSALRIPTGPLQRAFLFSSLTFVWPRQ